MRRSAAVLGVALVLAAFAVLFIWYVVRAEDHRGVLTVTFLPGGEVFAVTPGGMQILIDGGSNVLRELGSVMPFFDRSIDAVVARAPDPTKTDGLVDVLSRYDVGFLGESAARSGAPEEASFAAAVAAKEAGGMHVRELSRGNVINFGDGIYLETLFPDRDATGMSPQDGCLILKLVYGDTSFLFSCGSPAIESYVAMLDGNTLKADVIFARSSTSPLFVGFAQAQFTVDADPCGTPAPDTSVFAHLLVPVSACTEPIVFTSDGRAVTKR